MHRWPLISFLMFLIWIGVFFGTINPEIENVESYQRSECYIKNTMVSEYECCSKTNCKCVSHCQYDHCRDLMDRIESGHCCTDKQCCLHRDENGYCEHWGDQRCNIKCGICTDFEISYLLYLDDQTYPGIHQTHCGRNKEGCVESKLDKFQENSTIPCWYRNPQKVKFGKPEVDDGIWALLGILTIFILVAILVDIEPIYLFFSWILGGCGSCLNAGYRIWQECYWECSEKVKLRYQETQRPYGLI
jgi:hypothetical protein